MNCETNKDDCQGITCFNGGRCIDGLDAFSCTCQQGYTGRNCEFRINECNSNPCRNGGVCEDLVNGYECKCPLGTSGKSRYGNTFFMSL